jgi:hypothetical protein
VIRMFLQTVTAAMVGVFSSVGNAQEAIPEFFEPAASSEHRTHCLLENEACRLTGEYSAVEFESRYGEVVAKLERPTGEQDVVAMSGFLRERDLESEIDDWNSSEVQGDGVGAIESLGPASGLEPLSTNSNRVPKWQQLLAKFERLQGARYEVPQNEDDLKTSLGFHLEVEIPHEDWMEILKVQIERALGVDPDVSELIIELFGVRSTKPVDYANPAQDQ